MTPRYQKPGNGYVKNAVYAVLTGLAIVSVPAALSAAVWARDTLLASAAHLVVVGQTGFDNAQFQALARRQAATDAKVDSVAMQIEEVRKITLETNYAEKRDDAEFRKLVSALFKLLKGSEQRAVLREAGIAQSPQEEAGR
jgi:hypothetical protein